MKKMAKKYQNQKFPGFSGKIEKGDFWSYPTIMDNWWHILTGSEQKALDYILRHTWGYKKNADSISYSQFRYGIKKKNGEILDRGCGIKSSRTLRKSLLGLERKGFIEITKIIGKTIFYKLKINIEEMESKELWEKVNKGMERNKEVTVEESKDTIDNSTINNKQYGFSSNKIETYKQGIGWGERPYFKGEKMQWSKEEQFWKVIPKEGGPLKKFEGKEEEIEWQKT